MPLPPFDHGTDKVGPKSDPHQGYGDINGPFEFGVFLGSAIAQREGDCRCNDDGLPTPEIEAAQEIAEHAGFKQALGGIIYPCEDGIAHKGKNNGIGMEWSEAAKTQP